MPEPDRVLGVAGRAIIRGTDGRVLLIRRSDTATSEPGVWELPGGKMDHGERLVDALTREVQEETGLIVVPRKVVHVGHRLIAPYWVTSVTFVCDHMDRPILLSDEHTDHDWVSPPDLDARPLSQLTVDQIRALPNV